MYPRHSAVLLPVCLLGFAMTLAAPARAQWNQWGGPNRDFHADSKGLAKTWPKNGPRKVWERPLGDGYSGIAVVDGVLYTMHGNGKKETACALDGKTGKPLWEHSYAIKLQSEMDRSFGIGPRSTPLVVGDRVYTAGISAVLTCMDRQSGSPVWSHDLLADHGGTKLYWGWSASPIAYKNTIIIPVGGKGHGVIAFDQNDGKVVWAATDFDASYGSPILIKVDGEEQLVCFVGGHIIGLDPATGAQKWQHAHETSYNVNASTPIWGDDNILYCSSAYGTGSRGLQLSRGADGQTTVKELWRQRKMQVHHGSAIRIGDLVYGSSGDNGPTMTCAVNIKTGELAFRQRGVAKGTWLLADGKLILLDEDGNLSIGTPTDKGVELHATADILQKVSWTVPTLVGKTLYVRDRKKIMALDLG